ncbi:uncharacterized protein LOC125117397 [Phacochoerus africanus]|uniref:uncharacterized protein LOC125117397 n=1 Tax=Phacochoerus africanus TaxID=41426 RepID=UPI001FD8B0B0|nr:uncharacterized protein LOC125117397 [Phacochoerus africanus]
MCSQGSESNSIWCLVAMPFFSFLATPGGTGVTGGASITGPQWWQATPPPPQSVPATCGSCKRHHEALSPLMPLVHTIGAWPPAASTSAQSPLNKRGRGACACAAPHRKFLTAPAPPPLPSPDNGAVPLLPVWMFSRVPSALVFPSLACGGPLLSPWCTAAQPLVPPPSSPWTDLGACVSAPRPARASEAAVPRPAVQLVCAALTRLCCPQSSGCAFSRTWRSHRLSPSLLRRQLSM